jgi:hypothetical protein
LPKFRNGKVIGKCNPGQIQTAYGKITMMTRRQYFADPMSSLEEITTQPTTREFSATIKAIFDHPRFQANLTVDLHQRALADGFLSLCSSISVGMIREDDSPVFGFVECGDMEGFRAYSARARLL